MANSIDKSRQGTFWCLGNIVVPTPGTPVSIMSLVDSAFVNAPETPTPGTAGANEYTNRAQQITFQGYKAGAGPPALTPNTGNIYIKKKPITGGASDLGIIIAVIPSGGSIVIGSAALNRNVFNLYDLYIDADTASDACQVSAIIQ